MDHKQVEENLLELNKLVMAQQGAMAAQRVMIDSIVSALAGLPAFVELVSENLTALKPHIRDELEADSVGAFDSTIAHFNRCFDVMRQT